MKNTDPLPIYTIYTTKKFDKWLAALQIKNRPAAARIQVRIDRAESGNFGDCQSIGQGCSEMRIHFGPGYRVYFMQEGKTTYVLLCGGDKSTQEQDIKKALAIAGQLRAQSEAQKQSGETPQ